MKFITHLGIGLIAMVGFARSLGASPLDTPLTSSSWLLDPSTSTAETAFLLTARNDRYSCATEFSHQVVTVNENNIQLGFTATNNPAIKCAKPIKPYGPAFKIPALKAGKYEVTLIDAPACVWSQPACKIAVLPEKGGTLNLISEGENPYEFSFSPKAVEANKPFGLDLLSYNYNCGTAYSHLSAQVANGQITLAYVAKNNPAAICPAIYKPYGPTFKVEALKAGVYKILATPLQPCMVSNPACEIAVLPVLVGELRVNENGITQSKWMAMPKEVPANQSFKLNLLSKDYGNCQTSFSHIAANVVDGEIIASFLIESHPERVCITNISPFGPVIEMPALKAGRYPIRVQERIACEFEKPMCAVGYLGAPGIVDTLIVTEKTIKPYVIMQPEKVMANKAFDLTLSSTSFNCNAILSNKQVAVANGIIHLSFDITLTKMLCATTPGTIKQEAFKVPALKVGEYKVVIDAPKDCGESHLLCALQNPIVGGSRISVYGTLTTHPNKLGRLGLSPGISMSEGALHIGLDLVQGGKLGAQLYSAAGRRLERFSPRKISAGKQVLSLPLTQTLKPGVYFLETQINGLTVQRYRLETTQR